MKTIALESSAKAGFPGVKHLHVSSGEDLVVAKDLLWSEFSFEKGSRENCYWVLLCTAGVISLVIDGIPSDLAAGTFIVFRPGTVLEQKACTADARVDFVLLTDISMNSDLLLDNKTALCIYRYFIAHKDIRLEISGMESIILQHYFSLLHSIAGYHKILVHKGVLSSFVSVVSEMLLVRQSDRQITTSRNLEYLDRFLKKVALHHKEERKLRFYADALYISSKHLSATIKEMTGKTAGMWIDEFVIQDAKRMLRLTGDTVQEIAYSLNFPNPSFFGKYFKQRTGITPLDYRYGIEVNSINKSRRTEMFAHQ